jgi:hypothetical protein
MVHRAVLFVVDVPVFGIVMIYGAAANGFSTRIAASARGAMPGDSE